MSNILWQLENLELGRRLCDVTLNIEAGVTAILGQSGAGKTSLLNLLVGFETPNAGKLAVGFDRGAHRIPVFWAPADDGLWPHLTVSEHIAAVIPKSKTGSRIGPGKQSEGPMFQVGGQQFSLSQRERAGVRESRSNSNFVRSTDDQVEYWLDQFDLTTRRGSRPETLSAGEQARLSVARALAADAAVLVMDEPLVHVDPARIGKYWRTIRQHLAAKGASLVFATHSPKSVLAEARRVICLQEGRVLYHGDVEELYWRAASPELAACLGEANWLEPDEARMWLQRDERTARCFRPEQISVQLANQSPFIVESASFQGVVAEVEVRHEPTGTVRTFFHRPSANHLGQGARIVLKALLCLLFCLHLAGCGGPAGPAISVTDVHSWPVPPEGVLQPAARSLAIDNDGDVVALDTGGRVLVYAPDGSLAKQWHMPDNKNGNPEGVCVLHDGRVVVGDTHYHRVVIFAPDGQSYKTFGKEGRGPGEFIYPVAVTKDAQENLYIAEYGSNDRVQKFTSDGHYLLTFGSFGTKPGQFQRPSGLVWHDGKIYAADAFNNRIQVFTDDGKFLKVLDSTDQSLDLQLPYDLKIAADDTFYAVEYGAGRVTHFDLNGHVLGRYGSTGTGLGQFDTPWGIAVDSHKHIYVADTGNRRVIELQMP